MQGRPGPRPGAEPARPAGPATTVAPGRVPPIPGANDVLATVTDDDVTDKVTKGELVNFLSRYPIPANENREQVYHDAVDSLVNTKLLTMFLNRQKIAVPPGKIEEEIARLEQQLKAEGQDLATALLENNIAHGRHQEGAREPDPLVEYVKAKATDAELRRYVAANRDLFSGTQVRASHILLKVDPTPRRPRRRRSSRSCWASRSDIEAGKISFAEAANKYSEDPANAGGAGGDLDYFTLNSGFIHEFTDVAFKLKKGAISDPVETPYGYHLIQVTDRKEGRPVDFEQNKPYIHNVYAGELQKDLLTERAEDRPRSTSSRCPRTSSRRSRRPPRPRPSRAAATKPDRPPATATTARAVARRPTAPTHLRSRAGRLDSDPINRGRTGPAGPARCRATNRR